MNVCVGGWSTQTQTVSIVVMTIFKIQVISYLVTFQASNCLKHHCTVCQNSPCFIVLLRQN